MILRANFSAGGLTLKMPCVYLLVLRRGTNSWRYVGKTGTSNNTGTSSPYARLAKHIVKIGNTQSCIWDAVCLPKGFLNDADISFSALPLEKDEVKQAECWLRWRLGGKQTLNKEKTPEIEPDVSAELRLRLTEAFMKQDESG